MSNPFDQFDEKPAGGVATVAAPAPAVAVAPAAGVNPFDQFDEKPKPAAAKEPNPFDQFDEPTSSGVGDFLKRTGKAALEGTGDALMGVGRAAQHVIDKADRAFWLPTDDEIAAKAGRDKAGNVYQGVPAAVNAAKAAAGFVTSLPDEYTKGSLAIDPKRDSGKAAVAANMLGSLAPAVLSGAAAPVVIAGQIGEGERKNAIAQGESEELANARFDLGFSVGLPAAALGPVARKGAGLVQRVVTKAVTGAAAGAVGSAALDLAQGRDVNAKSAALNAGVLGGMGGFMGLKGETPAARAARDVAPATNTAADINHEANIAEIAKASGLPIDKVRADYFEERGQSAPKAVKPAEAAPAASAAEAPVAAKEANPFDQFDPKPAAEVPGGASAQALVQKYPEQLSSMPPNHIPVEIQAADGSVYPAVMNGFYDDAGKLVSVGRMTEGGWSHGLPKPGEKILTPLPTPAEWDSGIREGTTSGEAHPDLAPLPEGASAEYLGRKHLIMEGVGEPMDQWQVKLPGDERGRTMTTEQLQAEGFRAPEVPATSAAAVGQDRAVARPAALASEAGSIDPRVMLAFGRAAAGGVAGFMTGDTKEEKARNAIIGAGLAMGAPWMANFLRKTSAGQTLFKSIAEEKKNFWQKTDPLVLLPSRIITPSGGENFRALVRSAYGEGSAAAKAIAGQGMAVGKDLGQAINAAEATAAGRDALKGQVHQFLTGDAQVKAQVGPQLPIKVYAQASRARYLIDALSDDLIARGVVAGDMAQTILSNKGQYLRRSYEAFSNPSFEYDPKKVQAAIDAVHNEMIWKSQTGGGAAPGALPTRAEAESLVAALMDKHAPDKVADFMTGQGKIGGKDISVLMRRQDLLPEVRSLLGEITDPTFNIPETMSRMGRLLEADRTQKNIAAMGQQFGLFKTVRDLQFRREISTSERQSNFNGLYAEPHIADAFNRIASSGKVDGLGAYMGELVSKEGALAKLVGMPTYAVKFAATAMNPISYAPNFLHGLWANVAQGNFRFDNAGKALMLGAEESGLLRKAFPQNPSRVALQNEINYLTKQGVFGGNLVASELAEILQSGFYAKLGDKAVTVLKAFGAPDKYNDHFNKYIAFKSEQARYAAALPNATAEEVSKMAVQRVTDTLPTYSKIPELLKGLSRASALQQFVSFPYELLRNTANTYRYGLEDIRNGMSTSNGELVKAGAARLATMTAVLGAASAFGASKLSRINAGVTDKQDRELRVLLPPWLKSAELVYRDPIKDGKAAYANMSYMLAYSEAIAPLNDAVRELQGGGDGTQAFEKMLDTLKERFTGSSMFLPAAIGAATGVDIDSKRQIPSSDVTPTAKDRAAYFWNKVRPGIVRWSDQTAQAIQGQEGKYGQAFDLSSQLSKLVGVRTQVSDIPKLIDYRVRDLSDQIENASRIYKTSLNRNLPVEQMQKQYELSEAARLKVFNNLRQVYDAGRALGTPEERIVEAFEKAKADPRDILAVLDDRYRPQDYGEKPSAWNLMAKIRELPAANQAIEIAKVYAQDPGMGRTLEAIYKKDVRGITGRDGVIARLGVNNGERAAYLRDKLISLQTPAERQALLVDLARKGLVSPLVIQQMTQRQPAARN